MAGYKFGFISAYEKFELIYSIVLVIENRLVNVNDPYGFRLLLMGKMSNNVAVTTSSSSGGLFSWLIRNQSESIPPFDFPLPIIFEIEVFGVNGLQNDKKALNHFLDAFCSVFSLKDIAFDFCVMGWNVDLAGELLYVM